MNTNDNGHIVCGWYTPDYARWAETLRGSLGRVGEQHDIVEVPFGSGGWERTTLRKPGELAAAMRRHPGRTIIFLDVDCEVLADLEPLAAIRGDIGLHMRLQRKSRGNGRLFARSGTIVARQTQAAHTFVAQWWAISKTAPGGYTDQYTLAEAIARTPGLTVENLDVAWCATAGDHVPNPHILHDSASKQTRKVSPLMRSAHHWWHLATRQRQEAL